MTKDHDLIYRQAAIDAVNRAVTKEAARWSMQEMPSVDAVPVEWIEEEIKRLREMDNDFAGLTSDIIHTMLKRYRKENRCG